LEESAFFNAAQISLAELQGGEAPVNAVLNGLQLLVGAGFHDTSAGDDDDSIHLPHGGEPMGDDKRSAPAHQGFQRFLNQAFAFRIQGAGGFIQNEDGGILQDRARDGDALTLAATLSGASGRLLHLRNLMCSVRTLFRKAGAAVQIEEMPPIQVAKHSRTPRRPAKTDQGVRRRKKKKRKKTRKKRKIQPKLRLIYTAFETSRRRH